MSNKTFNHLWHRTQYDLEKTAVVDFEYQAMDPHPDRHSIQFTVFEIYAKYITICNRLEEIYDQMLQPQKRTLIRRLLDCCLGRVVEIRLDLVNLDFSEFSYNEDILEKLKLTPLDLQIRIPRYFIRERKGEIEERRKFIEEVMKRVGFFDEEELEEELTELDAIRIIQMHERARQGRLRAQFMKEIKFLKEKGKPDSGKEKAETGLMAALKIQKMWRGFATRRQTRRRKMEEMILIGMIPPPVAKDKEAKTVDETETARLHRYQLQEQYQKDYEISLERVRNEIDTKQGAQMKEDIAD